MVKKKASLAGRGAEILFGTKAPPTLTDSSASDAQSDVAFESNQQGDADVAAGLSPPPERAEPPPLNTLAPLEVSPDHPAPVPPVLPPGTVIDVAKPAAPPTRVTAMPARAYDIPPPADAEHDATGTPRPAVLPPLTVITPTASPVRQPATASGGSMSNPPSTPPSRGTSVVSPTSAGPQSITPAAPPPPAAPAPSGNGAPPAPIPMPPPVSAPSAAPQPQASGVPVSDILRIAAQISADREAAVEAARKAKDETKVDPELWKNYRNQLFTKVQDLYDRVPKTMEDSPWLIDYYLGLLQQARLSILSSDTAGDLSLAELDIEKVDAKLGRHDDAIPQSQRQNIIWIFSWQVVIGFVSLLLATIPWTYPNGLSLGPLQLGVTPSGTAAGSPLDVAAKVFLALLASIGWGGVGAVVATLYNLPWFISKREYDPAFNLTYVAGPVKGLVVGATMFLIVVAGIITSGATNTSPDKYLFAFVVSFLAGFKQEYVFQLFDDILRVIFRPPHDNEGASASKK